MNFESASINPQTLYKIFLSALSKKRTTRTELAKLCSLSAMTTGRAADLLVEKQVLRQSNTVDSSYKHRSKVLFVKQKFLIGVYIIAPEGMFFYLLDLSLKPVVSYMRPIENDIFLDDALCDFLKCTKHLTSSKTKPENLIGIGVLTAGNYSKEADRVSDSPVLHLGSVSVAKTFQKYCGDTPLFVESLYSVFGEGIRDSLSVDDSCFSFIISKGAIMTSYIRPGDASPVLYKSIGVLKDANKQYLKKTVRHCPDPELLLPALAEIAMTVATAIPCSKISISGSLYKDHKITAKAFEKRLSRLYMSEMLLAPRVIPIDLTQVAASKIAFDIRKHWFFNYLVK